MNYICGFVDSDLKALSKIDESRPTQHLAMIIYNLDSLTKHYRYNREFYDFLDHVLLRLFTKNGIRSHFPILIESRDGKFFNREIFEMMHVDLEYLETLDVMELSIEDCTL